MSNPPTLRPHALRRPSRVPGGFDTDDDLSPMKPSFDTHPDGTNSPSREMSSLPQLPDDDSSLLPSHSESVANATAAEHSELDESDMNQKLLEHESSFIPELSHLAAGATKEGGRGADDTYLFGVPQEPDVAKRTSRPPDIKVGHSDESEEGSSMGPESKGVLPSPMTPPGAYKTPAPERQRERLARDNDHEDPQTPQMDNTSSLETMSSSPTAEAAARTVSRVISMTTMGGYETADDQSPINSPTKSVYHNTQEDQDETPRKGRDPPATVSGASSPTRSNSISTFDGNSESKDELNETIDTVEERRVKRPKFLQSRQSSQRQSYSSLASNTTDTGSDATLGADFALQSGGALPSSSSNSLSRPSRELSRSTSLGSMASGISGFSDDEGTSSRRTGGMTDLSTLEEEERPMSSHRTIRDDNPLTPRASIRDFSMPTDTIIANNVRDIEVPGTFARQYRQNFRSASPEKSLGSITPGFGRSGKSMTLKEHRSTVDRLGKENFDLKMKIHFLDQALQRRSEDGVKEMITENVQLKSDKLKLEKDNYNLRKRVRELERKTRDQDGGEKDTEAGAGSASDEEKSPTTEEEVLYLRERVETNEIEIEKLRTESMTKESEKRRLAEMIKSLGDGRSAGSEVGAREERDMWKDMLEAETAAREQADEDNRKLREELLRLKNDAFSANSRPTSTRNRKSSLVSKSTDSDRDPGRDGATSAASTLVEMERLKHENSELQKVVSAQTSTLISRNREKERLYQEIEDLKLGQRRGDGRSVAGDSIFERSASRARSNSRASNGTRLSRMSDNEREVLETKNGELRDQVSALKLENQHLKGQMDEVWAELEALDTQYTADAEQFNEDMQQMQFERDEAIKEAEDREAAFQDLKAEAQEEIDIANAEVEEKIDECQRLENELRNQQENLKALQAEMRSASEGIIRLEEDAQNNLQKYKAVQQELDETNRELEAMEKNLREANSKNQRLNVQQESSHNEIAFLREEQESSSIKIGDLESALKNTQMSLQVEKDRSRDLDTRLAEERHQREVVGSKEKQEVQRIMNNLNREITTAKEEIRKLKKTLSTRELELNSWKDKLTDLEAGLRETLGDHNGNRASFLTSITRLQKELDSTSHDLTSTRRTLDEKDTLLKSRDSLLESHGLESRRLAELLERERQARRADKHSFEQSLKSHAAASRTISQSNTRIAELENLRQADRRKLATVEQQYKDQLAERNGVLLTIWKRLSALCGPDWAHSNSLINGNLPSQEVIGNMLFWPGFSRNLLLAAKQLEGVLGGFKTRIKGVERELWKEYQTLEHNFEVRLKKMEKLEEVVQNLKTQQQLQQARPSSRGSGGGGGGTPGGGMSPEMKKLLGENRLLKAELHLLQSHSSHSHARTQSRGSQDSAGTAAGIPPRVTSRGGAGTAMGAMASTLMRHHSSSAVEHYSTGVGAPSISRSNSITSRGSGANRESFSLVGNNNPLGMVIPEHSEEQSQSQSLKPSQQQQRTSTSTAATNAKSSDSSSTSASGRGEEKWIHRLRELERRLKAEREARLLDRSGARKRVEEANAVNEELRAALEREKMRHESLSQFSSPVLPQQGGGDGEGRGAGG